MYVCILYTLLYIFIVFIIQISIVPRTRGALGFAQYLPSDQKLQTTEQVNDTHVHVHVHICVQVHISYTCTCACICIYLCIYYCSYWIVLL